MNKNAIVWTVLLSFISGQIFAQNMLEDPREARILHFKLNAALEHTDNRDSSKEGKVKNTDFYIQPRVDAIFKGDDKEVSDFFYAPSYRYRSDPGDTYNESELFHALGLDYNRQVGRRGKMRLIEHFNYTDDPAISASGTTTRRDSSYLMNFAEVGGNYYFSRQAYADMYGRYFLKRYDDQAASDQSDENKASVGFSFLRNFHKETAFLGMIDFSDYGYALGRRDFMSVQVGAGLESVISHDSRVSLRAGFQSVQYSDDSLDSDTSPYFGMSVNYSRVPTMRYKGSVNYSIREADVSPFASQTALDVSAGLEYDWDKNVIVGVDGKYHNGEYDALPAGAAYARARDGSDEIITWDFFVQYSINIDTTVKLLHRHEHVESDVNTDFGRNSTLLTFSRRF
jgi:hypothetical protein